MRDSLMHVAMMNALGELAPGQAEDSREPRKRTKRLGSPGAPEFVTGSISFTRKARVSSAGEVFQKEIKSRRGRHKVTLSGNVKPKRKPRARVATP